MQRRHFLRSAAGLGTVCAFPVQGWTQSANRKLTPVKFTLDFKVTGQTAPFFLAAAQGYYAEEGLDVQIDVGAGSVASITRVASGAYDLGLGDVSSLIEAHAKGAMPVQAVYQYYNRAPFTIIGRKDRGITTDFASLKGKKVAAAAVEATRRCWPMVAEQRKLGEPWFDWVTTDFSARDNVMVRGDVDAATYFHDSAISLFMRMPQQHLSVLTYADAGVHLYGNAVLANHKLMQERPEVLRAFLRATQKALLQTLEQPEAALAAVRAREPMVRMDQESARWKITRTYLANAETARIGLGHVDEQVLQAQIAQVAKTFVLSGVPLAAQVWNKQFLPEQVRRGASV